MADENRNPEKEYIIPLRKAWINAPVYERTGKAVKTIKKFIARHMKVKDRELDKVKLDIYFNNELWFRGRRHPPSKIKVRVVKEKGIVKVSLAETPEHVKFLKAKHEKLKKKAEEKKEETLKTEEKKEEKTEEQKKDEQEKEKAVEQANIKAAEQQIKEQKHLTKAKGETHHRMALQK